MINKKEIATILIIGFLIGTFMIQPIGIGVSFFIMNNDDNFLNLWETLKLSFIQSIGIGGFDQFFKSILFGILGSSIAVMYYLGFKCR